MTESSRHASDSEREYSPVILLPVPLLDVDANALGELLRSMTFVGEGYGCYSTFDVRPDATPMSAAEAKTLLTATWDWREDPEDWFTGHRYGEQGVAIEACWVWDGDGTLLFRIHHDGHLLRAIENTDCKKSYRWEDVDLSVYDSAPTSRGPEEASDGG